jgi:hypothetical protein
MSGVRIEAAIRIFRARSAAAENAELTLGSALTEALGRIGAGADIGKGIARTQIDGTDAALTAPTERGAVLAKALDGPIGE